MNERLTKAERIRQRAEYLRIQGHGRKLHTPSFICFGMQRQAAESSSAPESPEAPEKIPARLGITVSRRVGGAVVRNRVKRLVREAYRRQKAIFPGDTELVVIARPEAAKVAYADVFAQLAEVGRRIKSGGVRSRS